MNAEPLDRVGTLVVYDQTKGSRTMNAERITWIENGRKKSAILDVTQEDKHNLLGFELNREGERISPRGADQRMRVIAKSIIIRRQPLTMNLHYGILEPDLTESKKEDS